MTNPLSDKKAQLLPFHAINEFMRNDYRLSVVRTTLSGLSSLPGNFRAPIDRLTKKVVKVPGFRNASKAPTLVKVIPMADAFEKDPELVAAILNARAELHPELRKQIYDLLILRGWDILPLEADRTKLPGFFVHWPKGEDFETLNQVFNERYPEARQTNDDISLMVVWVSTRLPYQIVDQDETERFLGQQPKESGPTEGDLAEGDLPAG